MILKINENFLRKEKHRRAAVCLKYYRLKNKLKLGDLNLELNSVSWLSRVENNRMQAPLDILSPLLQQVGVDHFELYEENLREEMDVLLQAYDLYSINNYDDVSKRLKELELEKDKYLKSILNIEYINLMLLLFNYTNQPNKAMELFEETKKLVKYNFIDFERKFYYSQVGGIYYLKKDFKKALEYSQMGIELLPEENDAITYFQLALISNSYGNFLDAAEFASKAHHLYESEGHYVRMIFCDISLATSYASLGWIEHAAKIFDKAIAAAKNFNERYALFNAYFSKGKMHYMNNDFEESILLYEEALSLYDVIEEKDEVLITLAYLHFQLQTGKCKLYLSQLDSIDKKSHLYDIKQALMSFQDKKGFDVYISHLEKAYKKMECFELFGLKYHLMRRMIEFYERNRHYKEANELFKKLIEVYE